jgi:hypothetical protein
MNTKLRSRLERLEAQTRRARQSVIRIGIVRQLPDDFVGERHIAPVERGAPGTPDRGLCGFEERPGPAPHGSHFDATRIYISEEDAML